MDEEQQKQVKTIGLIVLVVIALAAVVITVVKGNSSQHENVVGSLDGTGPGAGKKAPVGMRDASAGETRPANVEGGRGQ